MRVLLKPPVLFVVTMLIAMAIDLGSKVYWIQHDTLQYDVFYNPNKFPFMTRLLLCTATVIVIWGIAEFAKRRGMGEVRWIWVAGGLTVGGVMAQAVSGWYWKQGVPDFIYWDQWVMNIADFQIFFGPMLFMVAAVGYATHASAKHYLRREPAEVSE